MAVLLTRSLAVICPSCDFLNVAGAVRCMSCGSATDAAPATQPSTQAADSPKLQPQRPQAFASSNEETVKGVPLAAVSGQPPGLRRSPTMAPTAPPPGIKPMGEPLGSNPPSGSFRGPPQRPTFQSSSSPSVPAAAGPKLGLSVLAGPARGQRFRLAASGAQIGRQKGLILFPDDPFVSPLHATLLVRDGKLFIRDEGSTSGVYVSVAGQETIEPNSYFCAGLRLFRFVGALEPAPPWNRLDVVVYGAPLPNGQTHYIVEEVLLGDRPGRAVATPGPVFAVGQRGCDFNFPNEEGLAPRHCELSPLPTGAMIRDLSAGLGTYVRANGERALKPGDKVRIGQQTLQVEALQ